MTILTRNILVLLFCFASMAAIAQEKYVKEGDKYFNQRLYSEAISSYQKAIQGIKPSREPYVQLQLARAYKNVFDYKNAASWFSKIKDNKDNQPEVYRDYGYVLLATGEYDKALEQFRTYCSSAGKE